MGQVLFDLSNGRNIRLYAAADMREQALHTVAIENPRGFRITKEKTTSRIDSIVALAMACAAGSRAVRWIPCHSDSSTKRAQ